MTCDFCKQKVEQVTFKHKKWLCEDCLEDYEPEME